MAQFLTKEKGFQLCARCHAAAYCSRECQRGAWPTHKRDACDIVVACVASLKKQGLTYVGPCDYNEAIAAQKSYPACADAVFATFHKFARADGEPVTTRFHSHPPGSQCVEEAKTVKCYSDLTEGVVRVEVPTLNENDFKAIKADDID